MKKRKDYRVGKGSHERRTDAQSAIREALAKGKKTFTGLLEDTGLSRPAVALNLKEMHKNKEIERQMDSMDYRITLYSLTDKGWKQYEKQKDLESLKDMEFLSIGEPLSIIKGAMMHMIDGVTILLESPELPALHEGQKAMLAGREKMRFPRLQKKEREILENCLSISVYSSSKGDKSVPFAETLREFIVLVKLLASSKDINRQRLEKLPNLTFMFQLNSDLLIKQYEQLKTRPERS